MTKSEIINNIANKTNSSKASCEAVLDVFIEEVKNCLVSGDRLIIKGFLSLETSERAARNGRNPSTGEIVQFPAIKTVKCKFSKDIKDAINGKVIE